MGRLLVLGPISVLDDSGRVVALGRRHDRLTLAVLAANAGSLVTQESLCLALWPASPPPSAAQTVRSHISRLRRVLGDALQLTAAGYIITVNPESSDVALVEWLQARAADAERGDGDYDAAAADLSRALDLWRGPPYADVASEPSVHLEVIRLTELQARLQDRLAEVELARGRHAVVLDRLHAWAEAEPLREPRWFRFALALYRCGRQADALAALARLRAGLYDAVGVEPQTEARCLEAAIHRQAPELEWQCSPARP